MVNRPFLAAVLASFLLASAGLFAQEVGTAPRRMAIFFTEGEDGAFDRRELVLLYEGLLAHMQTVAETAILVESRQMPAPEEDGERDRLARELGADSWLSVVLQGSADAAAIRVRAVDLLIGASVVDLSLERRGIRGVERQYWDDVARAVAAQFQRIPQRTVGQRADLARVEIRGIPGTVVSGEETGQVVLGPDGTARVELVYPGLYTYRATVPGYLPRMGTVYIDREDLELALRQVQEPRWGVDVYAANGRYLGAAGHYALDRITLSVAGTFFGFSLDFRDQQDIDREGSLDRPLTHLFLGAGYRLTGPERLISAYVDGAVMVRLVRLDGNLPELDPFGALGARIAVGAAAKVYGRSDLFLEYGQLVYFGDGVAMEAAGGVNYGEEDRPGGFVYAERFVIDLLNLRIGMRWTF